jgi:RNA polymerase sigma factor (sigma-70 family)
MTREHLLVSQLAVIDRVIAWVCARRCLRGADAEDFGSVVKTRLLEKDCEILARFQGRSSLKTYLAVVVNRMYLDFQAQRFGKWRASAEARRHGPVALRLECLLFRDGLSFDEACGVLQADRRVAESREALHALSQRIPPRVRREGQVREDEEPAAAGHPLSDLERAERQVLAGRTFEVIRRSLARLPARDRLFLRLHLEQELTVAEVSRSLGLEQKPLYRRKEEILRGLRADLEAEGIGAEEARELLSALDWDVALTAVAPGNDCLLEDAGLRPSQVEAGSGRREIGR